MPWKLLQKQHWQTELWTARSPGTPERAGAVWSVRGGILEGMKADSVAQEECDVVVPRARIAEYVKDSEKDRKVPMASV